MAFSTDHWLKIFVTGVLLLSLLGCSQKPHYKAPVTDLTHTKQQIKPQAKLQAKKEAQPVAKKTKNVYTEPEALSSATAALPKGAVDWQWPAQGRVIANFSSENAKKGIDIGGKNGQPILAAAPGVVVYSGSGLRGYGQMVIIKHNDLFLSAYAHNSRLLVKEGDVVKAHSKIAEMGQTDTETVRLHFEIRKNGMPVGPMLYLPKRAG